mmetsp:Transcript_46813/g.92124  ORF Transcript_46813/g.92124 Transcript_46813/m.92124 type:complete len:106 (-) Transcript_46813:41-358(-)
MSACEAVLGTPKTVYGLRGDLLLLKERAVNPGPVARCVEVPQRHCKSAQLTFAGLTLSCLVSEAFVKQRKDLQVKWVATIPFVTARRCVTHIIGNYLLFILDFSP